MKKVYGVAIIGCGYMGDAHISDIFDDPAFEMICACDLDMSATQKFQQKYGFKRTTTSSVDCINDEDVDIVIIATYPSSHISLLKMSLEAGKHVLCEKPICTNEEEAKTFVKLLEDYPHSKVLVGFILRHKKSYIKIAEMIQSGTIGFPLVFRMHQNRRTTNWPRFRRLICETSPIVDCGVHYFDVMQWFTGAKVIKTEGVCQRTEGDLPHDVYNYGMVTAKLSDGSIGYYEIGWGNSIETKNTKEFVGPLGRIRLVLKRDRLNNREEGDLIEHYDKRTGEYRYINIDEKDKPTGDQLKYLVRMIEEGLPPVPKIRDVVDIFNILIETDKKLKQEMKEENLYDECISN